MDNPGNAQGRRQPCKEMLSSGVRPWEVGKVVGGEVREKHLLPRSRRVAGLRRELLRRGCARWGLLGLGPLETELLGLGKLRAGNVSPLDIQKQKNLNRKSKTIYVSTFKRNSTSTAC